MTRVALLLTMIAGAPLGFAYAQIHATMETEFGIHGVELNDSKSPPPFFSQSVITGAQLSASEVERYSNAGTFFSGSTEYDALSSTITSFVESDRWSLHENASTKANKRTPRKPTNVTVVPGGSTADCTVWNCFTISWTPQAEPGKPITDFEIQESRNGSTWFLNASFPFPGGRYRYEVDDSDPRGTTYYIRIRNRDADGWGPWSDVVSAATRAIALYPVEGLRVNAEGIHQHRLGWVAPTDRRNLNDAGFKQYTVEWSSDNINWSELGEIDLQFSTEFIHRSNQLTPGETFYYRVKVTNTKNEVSAPS